jgi:hypothetical protein
MMSKSRLIRLNDSSAVRVGNIWVRAADLPDALSRFTRLVFCLTTSEDQPYSLRGSATSLRWRNQHLVFLCNHQIAGFQPQQVVFPLDRDGKALASGSTVLQMKPSDGYEEEEFADICAMLFRPKDYQYPNIDRAFFELLEADLWRGDRESTFIIYGYPTSLRELEFAEPTYALSHIKVLQTVIAASYLRPSQALGVHALEMQRSGSYSADGLSGGPVFQLGEDARGFFCGFAGMVIRGGDNSEILHFIDANLLMQFMKRTAIEDSVEQHGSKPSVEAGPTRTESAA